MKTLADHLRKRRMDLGLPQREAAKRIGVSKDTYRFWESNATHPLPRQWPSLIQFLGGFPFPIGRDLPEQLRAARLCRGLAQRELVVTLGVDLATLSRWESRVQKPGEETVARLREWVREVLREVPKTSLEEPP